MSRLLEIHPAVWITICIFKVVISWHNIFLLRTLLICWGIAIILCICMLHAPNGAKEELEQNE